MRLALAIQMAGALGNLIDRLTVGAVTDFISIFNFPVFNEADASISFGVVILLLPFLPHIPAEWTSYQRKKLAQQINLRGRISQWNHNAKPAEDDSITLGVLDVLLEDTPPAKEFILSQRAKRIHHNQSQRQKPIRGRERQIQLDKQ
jgi:hypothetical protein